MDLTRLDFWVVVVVVVGGWDVVVVVAVAVGSGRDETVRRFSVSERKRERVRETS